jgi:hypothetical protein
MFSSLDIKNVLGYPNHFSLDWGDNCLKFDGDPSLVVTHVVKLLKYDLDINVRTCIYINKVVLGIFGRNTK